MYQKLKGIVKNKTLLKILHGHMNTANQNAIEVSYLSEEDKVFYATKISNFYAERKDQRTWWVYQILGE